MMLTLVIGTIPWVTIVTQDSASLPMLTVPIQRGKDSL